MDPFTGAIVLVVVVVAVIGFFAYFAQKGRDALRAEAVAGEIEKRKNAGTL